MAELAVADSAVSEFDIERALPIFDVHGYVEDFGASVMPAYRTGSVSVELQATNVDRLHNWRTLQEMAGTATASAT